MPCKMLHLPMGVLPLPLYSEKGKAVTSTDASVGPARGRKVKSHRCCKCKTNHSCIMVQV